MKQFYLRLLAIMIILCLGVIAYSNTFQGSFHFDDEPSITNNFAVKNIRNLKNIWKFWPTRFIVYLSIVLNYHFNQLNVFGYHVFNFTVHLATSLLVWWLALLTLNTPLIKKETIAAYANTIASFTSAIFLLHPLQTQPVNYIIQRATLLATFFYIASLCLYVKARLKQKQSPNSGIGKLYYTSSLLAALMGMFSKEMAITLPLTICLYEFCFLRTKNRFTWKYIVPFFAIALVMPLTILITKSVDVQSMRRIGEDAPELSSGQYFLTQLRVMATYIRLMLLPINQNLDYYYPALDSILQIPVILSLLLMLFILSIAFKLLKNYRLISFSIFWFFITLLPESSVIPIRDVMVEHRLYLPMLGFSFFLVSGLYYLFKQKSVKLKVTILLLLVICYSVMTYQRNRVWKDEFSLWTDTVRKSPLKARPYLSRGLAYQMKGDFDQALSDFGKVIEINPNNAEAAEAYYDRGLLYENKGELEQSILEYNKAIKLRPNLAKAYNNRAIVYQKKGDLNQALLDYNKAIEIDPGYVEAYYNRGIIYQIKGDLTRAISDYNKAIEIYPNLAAAYTNRAIAYQMKGDFSQALFDYNKAIEIDPNNTQAYYNRAVMYFEKQQYAKSWEDVHKAQVLGYQVNPKFIEQLKKLSGREK